MNSYISYEAINAIIRSKSNRMLRKEDYMNILNCSSLKELIKLLEKDHRFKDIIQRLEREEIHRDDLETIADLYKVDKIEKLIKFSSGPYKEFFRAILLQNEIEDLILIIRRVSRNESMEDIEKHFIHSQSVNNIPYKKLIEATSINQVRELLKNTIYYDIIKNVKSYDVVKREFHLEMKLELLWNKIVFTNIKKLKAQDRKLAVEFLGNIIDMKNLKWIYRALKYYEISPEEIFIYCLQGGKRISYGKLKKLCYSKSLEEFCDYINKYIDVTYDAKNNEIPNIELELDRQFYRALVRTRKTNVNRGTIGNILMYISMIDTSVKDLTVITEGIRYELPKEKIISYLIQEI